MNNIINQENAQAEMLRRIKSNIGILLGGSGVVMLLNLATSALNARALGPHGLGIVSLFQTSALMVMGLFSFGVQQPVIRLGKQSLEKGQVEKLGIITSMAMLIDILTSIAAGLFSLLMIKISYHRLNIPIEYYDIAQLYAVAIALTATSAANGIFRLFNRFHYLSLAQVFGALAQLTASTALYILKAPLATYLILNALVLTITAVAQVALAINLLKSNGITLSLKPEHLKEKGILREFLEYAKTTAGTSMLDTVRTKGDTVLLGYISGSAPVGVYYLVKQIAGTLNKAAAASSSAVFPEISGLASQNQLPEARKLVRNVAWHSLAIGSIAVTASTLLGGELLAKGFGEEFRTGWSSLILLTLAATISFMSTPYSMYVQAAISPERLMHAHLISFLGYLTVVIIATENWGITGAAIAQVTFALALLSTCWHMHRPDNNLSLKIT